MQFEELIEIVKENIQNRKYHNEASISMGIVWPILEQLEWPIRDPSVVIPEYELEGRRVDFALCHPQEKPVIFIEVKRLGNITGADKQLFEYAYHKGVPLAILTDGQEWHFFLPGGIGDYRERRVYKLDLLSRKLNEITGRLKRYLSYPLVCSREAFENARKDYEDVTRDLQIAKTLPTAWQELISNPDELLLELLADKVADICGFKPKLSVCEEFLKEKLLRSVVMETKSQVPSTYLPTIKDKNKPVRYSNQLGRKGYSQIDDYLIPVIKLMRAGKSHTEAFNIVSRNLGVAYQTVNAQCTRTLGIKTKDFVEYVESGYILQFLKNRYPSYAELLERELKF